MFVTFLTWKKSGNFKKKLHVTLEIYLLKFHLKNGVRNVRNRVENLEKYISKIRNLKGKKILTKGSFSKKSKKTYLKMIFQEVQKSN